MALPADAAAETKDKAGATAIDGVIIKTEKEDTTDSNAESNGNAKKRKAAFIEYE